VTGRKFTISNKDPVISPYTARSCPIVVLPQSRRGRRSCAPIAPLVPEAEVPRWPRSNSSRSKRPTPRPRQETPAEGEEEEVEVADDPAATQPPGDRRDEGDVTDIIGGEPRRGGYLRHGGLTLHHC